VFYALRVILPVGTNEIFPNGIADDRETLLLTISGGVWHELICNIGRFQANNVALQRYFFVILLL